MLGVWGIIRPPIQAVGGRRMVSLAAMGEGLRYVWTHPILLWMMLLDFGQNFLGAARSLLPIYASEIIVWPGTQEKVGAQGFGLLSGASAFGSIAGGILLSGLPHARRAGIGVLMGVSIFGASTVLFAYNEAFWIAWLLLAGEGFGDTVSQIFRTTILQLNIPDHLRGRVTSVNAIFINGGPSLGSVRAGATGQWLGPEIAVLSGGLAVLAVVALMGTAVPMVRRYVIEPAARSARAVGA
jgi:MFS family permease